MVCEVELLRKYFIKHGDVFSGRWRNFITDSMLSEFWQWIALIAPLCLGGLNGVVQVDGEKWREQRRFSLHVLRDFGFGRTFMEEKIMSEVQRFMLNIEKIGNDSGVIEPERHLGVCVGNIINNILFGKTFEYVRFTSFILIPTPFRRILPLSGCRISLTISQPLSYIP